MKSINLDGNYKLKYFDYGTFKIEDVMREDFFPDDWIDAQVPEDVRTALRREGYLEGHYYGKDLDKERWIDEKDWVYLYSFTVDQTWDGHACVLRLDGVDTFAHVWLNGTLLGICQNMFLKYEFPIEKILRIGKENRLVVQVLSPIKSTQHINRNGIYPQEDTTRMLLRKSQMNWGWDFCGHCLTTGIWKSVWLQSRDEPALEEVRLTTKNLQNGKAEMHLQCALRNEKDEDVVEIEMCSKGKIVCTYHLDAKTADSFTFYLENPKLWWPKPYGEPFLYDVKIRLIRQGNICDEKSFRFGVRVVELLTPHTDGGRGFVFSVNGRRLFIRGANWVPLNCVYAEIRQEDYDKIFKRVLDSNLSMLRIWGGGIYESEHFFDLCDENGIMVFQDMMLACGIFPQNDDFLQQVYEETGVIVRQLYNRASLVIWSADNELDEAYRWYDKLDEFSSNKVNRQAIKKAVLANDTSRPFLVSSPCSPFEDEPGAEDPNSDLQGDMHLYLTRFKKDDEYYYKKILDYQPRFMSEYGFSSLPSEPSYSKFNFYRGKLDLVRNPWLAQLDWMDEIGKTGDKDKIIYYTQFTHAQALKYWIEYLRSLKWHCGGSLYWKFNDPIAPNREDMLFPSLMSSLDFYGLPKMPYYYARRAYEDRVLCFREEKNGNLLIYGCSESDDSVTGVLKLRLMDYNGMQVWAWQSEVCFRADTSAILAEITANVLSMARKYSCYAVAEFSASDIALKNIFHLTEIGEWNHVKLPQAVLKAEITKTSSDTFSIMINSDAFAQDVIIEFLDEDVYYTDNAFSLEPGESKTIDAHLEHRGSDWLRVRIKACNSQSICLNIAPEEDK